MQCRLRRYVGHDLDDEVPPEVGLITPAFAAAAQTELSSVYGPISTPSRGRPLRRRTSA